jgi:fatty acid desaturase
MYLSVYGERMINMTMDEWDRTTTELDVELARLRAHRDASRPGSDLYEQSQDNADRTHYRLLAYREARELMAALTSAYAEATSTAVEHWRLAVEDGEYWTRAAVVSGVLAAAGLLVWAALGWWWLAALALLSVAACVGTAMAGVAAHRDRPDTASVADLAGRIRVLRLAVESTTTARDLDRVREILDPRVPGKAVMRLL